MYNAVFQEITDSIKVGEGGKRKKGKKKFALFLLYFE